MTLISESNVQKALQWSAAGSFSTLHQAIKESGATKSTTYHRHAGRVPRDQVHRKNYRLTWDQEIYLAMWIRDLQLQYAPPNYIAIKYLASQFTKEGGDLKPIGPDWVGRFLKRHPQLASSSNQSLTKDRITATIPLLIGDWFQHVDEVLRRFNVAVCNRWNMDEIGFQMGQHSKGKVAFDRRCGPPKSLNSGTTN